MQVVEEDAKTINRAHANRGIQTGGRGMDKDSILKAIAKFNDDETDVFSYIGSIERSGYDRVCDALEKKLPTKKKKALLFLNTNGGNPNAGYRIARAFIHHYGPENFRVAVNAECKSAGTLICIGASSLVVCDRGELGPLDVQFQKQDEIFQQSSGLDILRGMTYLQKDALEAFNTYLMEINGGSGLSTKIASDIASKLVMGIYEPMYAQIDPIRLGEMNAALQIAHEYGTRLNESSKNLKSSALSKLINGYPTHGFVIDRAEARTLFENVEAPQPHEAEYAELLTKFWGKRGGQASPKVLDLTTFLEELWPKEAPNVDTEGNAESSSSGEELDAAVQPTPGSAPEIDAAEQPPIPGEPDTA